MAGRITVLRPGSLSEFTERYTNELFCVILSTFEPQTLHVFCFQLAENKSFIPPASSKVADYR